MPIRFSIPLLAFALFLVIGLAAGRRESAGDPNVIKIISSLPRSGSARGQTDTIVNGIKLAIHEADYKIELTENGQPKTYTLKYLDLDDATAAAGQWTIEQEIANAYQARNDPDVMVYIGTYNSGAAKVSMPILNKADLLMISPANTATSLTKPGWGDRHEPNCYRPSGRINYTRVVPADDVQGAVAAQWTKDLGSKKVYILDDNEVYGKGIADLYNATCKKLGIEVLGQESIDFKQLEFQPLLQRIQKLGPDLLYFGGTTQTKAGQIFKDMIAVGLKCPMMAPDGCYEQAMIDSAGKDSFEKAPFYVTFGGLPISELKEGKAPEFMASYEKLFRSPPKEAYAAYGYECGIVALDALRRAKVKNRDAVRVAGLQTKVVAKKLKDDDLVGVMGEWSFDANGDTTSKKMSGNTVKAGEFVYVRTLELK